MGVPVQFPIAGVMVYSTTAGEVEVLLNVCAIEVPQELLQLENPVAVPLIRAAVHEYVTVTPVLVVLRPTLVAVPLQMVWAVGVAVTAGVGSTVTSKLKGVPGQLVGKGPVGVITYLITPDEVPVLFRVWLIVVPQPEVQSLNPVIEPPAGAVRIEAVHVKVVFDVSDVIV